MKEEGQKDDHLVAFLSKDYGPWEFFASRLCFGLQSYLVKQIGKLDSDLRKRDMCCFLANRLATKEEPARREIYRLTKTSIDQARAGSHSIDAVAFAFLLGITLALKTKLVKKSDPEEARAVVHHLISKLDDGTIYSTAKLKECLLNYDREDLNYTVEIIPQWELPDPD